jgi:hypothetical protein
MIKLLIMQFSPVSHPFFVLHTDIFLNTVFSNTVSLCSYLNVRDHVSHTYSTTVLCAVMSVCSDSKLEDKRFYTEWWQTFPEFSLLVICAYIQF